MASLKRQPTQKETVVTSSAAAAPAPPAQSKYWLTADFFDFLDPEHPWKTKGNLLTASHVVDDAKHSTTAAKMQKKLTWLVQTMTELVDVRLLLIQ